MDKFNELNDLIKRSINCDLWIKDTGFEGYLKHIKEEVDELEQAFEKKDYENLKEEFSDVLRLIIIESYLAEDKNIFSLNDIMQSAIDKIKRRQPYVLQNKIVSKEDALRIWQDAKKLEKSSPRLQP